MTFFLFYYFSVPLIILGYGFIFYKLILSNKDESYDLGFLGLIGFLTLYFISNLFHFFFNFGDLNILSIQVIGVLLFFYAFITNKFKKLEITKLIILSIFLLPLGIIAESNEDFYHYYLPYMKYLEASKIIFGLVNINDTLAYSSNSLYDILILFKFPFSIKNSYSIPILFFFVFFLIFILNKVIKTKDLFYFFILILSVIAFSSLRDFGTSVPPQLILIICGIIIYECIILGYSKRKVSYLLCLLTLAIILRINSIIILPIFILLILFYYLKIPKYIKENYLLVICLALIISLFIMKNIIQSGCIVYPIHNTCFTKLTWGIDQKIVTQKNKKLQADSKGWPFYAKNHFNIKDKFVWKNLKSDNFITYSDYANTTPFFWLKYWIKDPNYKKIINLLLLTSIIYLLLLINSKKNIEPILVRNNIKYNLLILSSFLSCVLWLYLSPQIRYGGAFCFIFIFSVFFKYLNNIIKRHIKTANIIILASIAFFYLEYKNINRILDDLNNELINSYPWPNLHQLNINEDYVSDKNNNLDFNKRIYSKKLIFDNNSDYILMCGNIKFPCIPDGKEVCLGKQKKTYGYMIYSRKNKDSCYNFMNKNILY